MRLSNARLQAMAAGEHGARLATVHEAVEMARELLALRELERAVRRTLASQPNPCEVPGHAVDLVGGLCAQCDAIEAWRAASQGAIGAGLAKIDALGPVSD